MKKSAFSMLLAAAFLAADLQASSVAGATITQVTMDKDKPYSVFITVEGGSAVGLPPGCHGSGALGRFVVYDDGPTLKNMLALILSVQATSQKVNVLGDGYCAHDTEKIQRITLGN